MLNKFNNIQTSHLEQTLFNLCRPVSQIFCEHFLTSVSMTHTVLVRLYVNLTYFQYTTIKNYFWTGFLFCSQNINLFSYFRRWINIFASCCCILCCILVARRFPILAWLIGLPAAKSTNIIKKEAILAKFIFAKSFGIFRWNYFDLNFSYETSVLYGLLW